MSAYFQRKKKAAEAAFSRRQSRLLAARSPGIAGFCACRALDMNVVVYRGNALGVARQLNSAIGFRFAFRSTGQGDDSGAVSFYADIRRADLLVLREFGLDHRRDGSVFY